MKSSQITGKTIKRLTTLLYMTIILLGAGFLGTAVMYNKLTDRLTETIYFRTGERVYKGTRMDDYQVDEVEIRSHSKLFYSYQFSFGLDNYASNIEFTQNNLTDIETAKSIQNRFQDQSLYNRLVQTNSSIATVLDSADINMDGYPYRVKAYCTQYIYNSTGKSSLPFVNTFDVYKKDKRTDENIHGLEVRNWKNIRVE